MEGDHSSDCVTVVEGGAPEAVADGEGVGDAVGLGTSEADVVTVFEEVELAVSVDVMLSVGTGVSVDVGSFETDTLGVRLFVIEALHEWDMLFEVSGVGETVAETEGSSCDTVALCDRDSDAESEGDDENSGVRESTDGVTDTVID
jgi:hypothetical protein